MSCLLDEISSISGLPELITWLCPHLAPDIYEYKSGSQEALDKWDEKLGEEFTKPLNEDDTANPSEDVAWLEECVVALSPTVNLMAIACRNRVALLTNRWENNDKGEKKAVLSTSWKSTIGHTENDEISCVLCLPIISQKQSSSGAPDWTSIVVGFKSGYVSFYTESGMLLLSQIFEERPVYDISCRTYFPKNYGACIYSDSSEELVILYPKAVISIDGFSLLQTLKACRNQAAKAAASGENCDNVVTLGFKKWGLGDQDYVTSCVATGKLPPHLYDQMMYLSKTKGFHQTIYPGVPTTTQLITTGRMPFFGVIGIIDGVVEPFMSDIAMHYASKLKNAIFSAATGWLFGNRQASHSQAQKQKKIKIEQATPISFRYSLPDKRRIGLSIHLSLNRKLAAVTDEFGRISLIDIQKCYVHRMFKGYRDAECGWLTVCGDFGDMEREVPFLIIYAPRRNLLEIWLPQQGPRVAAFNVPKKSRLLYTPHSFLGAGTQQGRYFSTITIPVVMLNLNGSLERITIPFHLALSGKTSKQARDIHLVKSLKTALREEPEEQILKIIKEVQTTGMKLQLLNLIVSCRYITTSLAEGIISLISPLCHSQETGSDSEVCDKEANFVDHESRLLSQQLNRLSQMLQLYAAISSLHSNSSEEDITKQQLEAKLSQYLMVTSKDFSAYFSYLNDDKLQFSKQKQVTFNQEIMPFSSFIQCWDVTHGSVDKQSHVVIPVKLKEKTPEEKKKSLETFLFGWTFNPQQMKLFIDCLSPSGVDFDQLLHLSFQFWLNHNRIDERSTLRISFILYTLSILSQPFAKQEVCEVNPFWERVREVLIGWSKPFHAYVAALVCRGIESNILPYGHTLSEQNEKATTTSDSSRSVEVLYELLNKLESVKKHVDSTEEDCTNSSEEWEEFSIEIVEWNIILKRFRQLLSVQRLFNFITANGGKLSPDYSVKILSMKGKGYLSELISKWLIEANLPLEKLIDMFLKLEKEKQQEDTISDSADINLETSSMEFSEEQSKAEGTTTTTIDLIEDILKEIKKNFPQSMKCDVVLINLAWEFGALWKKSPNCLSNFESSILSLKNIANPFFKHGVGCMMWETWVSSHVQIFSNLMEKYRKIPVNMISTREIGISEFSLHSFLKISRELLEHIMAGNIACEVERPPVVTKDDFWKDLESSPSLADVAMAQKLTSCDLAFLHHQLLSVLCLVVQYDLKNTRPYSLFPERDRAAFFKPLFTSWRSTSEEGREVVSGSQLSFLCRVVTASVISLPDSPNSKVMNAPSGLHDSVELGRTWGVSVDAIRRHYICELYSSGLDAMADQALGIIRDGTLLASQMVVIAGQRLLYLITSSPKSMEVLSTITPQMKQWCISLGRGNLRCPDAPVENTFKMVSRAHFLVPESSFDYRISKNLIRSFETICNSRMFEAAAS